ATTPAGRPHIMSGPATGTANKLAGTDATGMPPKAVTATGATPTWAATVTARACATGLGPGSRWANGDPRTAMPNVAPTDSHQPTDHTSSGSISTMPATASASSRMVLAGRPSTTAVAANPPMAAARSTDGSNRVRRANHTIRPTVTPKRGTN